MEDDLYKIMKEASGDKLKFIAELNTDLKNVSEMVVGKQYIVDGVAKTLTYKSKPTQSDHMGTNASYELTFTFNNTEEEPVEKDWQVKYKEVVSDKDKDKDKDKEQNEHNTDLYPAFLEFCGKVNKTAEVCIRELSAEFEKHAENMYGTKSGGKRKSRRNRKSKKSRKGKSRKNRRKSNRRR